MLMFCIVCGCTETTPCTIHTHGSTVGCHWVSASRCSECAKIAVTVALSQEQFEALDQIHRHPPHDLPGPALRRILAAHLHAGRMTVRKESGEHVWRLTPSGRAFEQAHSIAQQHFVADAREG